MKLYSNTLTAADVHHAFHDARHIDGQDIYVTGMRAFQPRSTYRRGVKFYAYSLNGNHPTAHREIGSYSLSDVPRAASWDAYGYVIARLFKIDPDARIGSYDGQADFVRQVLASHRRESKDFLDMVLAQVGYCLPCQVTGHDTCSMTLGCPCCDDTFSQLTE